MQRAEPPSARSSLQICDLVPAGGCNLVADLTGATVAPDEILRWRSEPAEPTPHHGLGRYPFRFNHPQTGLLLRASALERALPEADKTPHDRTLARLLTGSKGGSVPLVVDLRHILRPPLRIEGSGIETVVDRLGLHPRAMRRRPQRAGTSFGAIKDEIRQDPARDLLRLGGLSSSDISATLDDATLSAVVQAFRRWRGTSPGLWRAAGRVPQA